MKRAYITAQEAVNLIKETFDADERVTGLSVSVVKEDGEFNQAKFGDHKKPAADAELTHTHGVK